MRQVGIEEEFLLFAADAARLIDAGPEVAASAEAATDGNGQFEKELKKAQAELATAPATELGALADELIERRGQLAAAAARRGARLIAAGTSPVGDATGTTDNSRYRQMADRFAAVERRQLTCAMHVHVAVESDDEGAAVLNGIAPWLPVLAALSANSPFHDGRDTRYASYRRVLWGQWPTAGPTGSFTDGAEYRGTVEALIATGAARDSGMIYFDARLSADYPTVEIRVCDVAIEPADAITIAGLCRALVETVAAEATTAVRVELLHAGAWRAARWGMTERLVDLRASPPRLVDAWQLVEALADYVAPALRATGDLGAITNGLRRIREAGTGAERQRAAVHANGGEVAGAVDAATVQAISRNRGST